MAERASAFMQQYAVPGFSVAIGRSGWVLYQEAFGWADREAGEAATTAHLFRVCSISKPVTSVAVFTLVEEGRLRLEAKVFGPGGVLEIDYEKPPHEDYLPEITIEHLLTHTSGAWPNNSMVLAKAEASPSGEIRGRRHTKADAVHACRSCFDV